MLSSAHLRLIDGFSLTYKLIQAEFEWVSIPIKPEAHMHHPAFFKLLSYGKINRISFWEDFR